MSLPPIERFRAWAASDGGKACFAAKIKHYGSRDWIEAQYRTMCDWIADNPKKGNKRRWAQFVGNWLRRAYSKRVDDIANSQSPGLMTAREEEDHYRKKRRQGKVDEENSSYTR